MLRGEECAIAASLCLNRQDAKDAKQEIFWLCAMLPQAFEPGCDARCVTRKKGWKVGKLER
jgi:hypothetical protein